MSQLEVFILLKLADLGNLFEILLIFSCFSVFALGFTRVMLFVHDHEREIIDKLKYWFKLSCVITIIFSVGAVLLPDQKEILITYIVPKVSQSDSLKNIPPLINSWLNAEVKSLQK